MTQESRTQDGTPPEQTVANVYRLLASALSDVRAGGLRATVQGDVFQQVLAELSTLDPDVQRKAARAMVDSGGDPDAVRAALREGLAGARSDDPPPARLTPRTPTVVDARGGFPWTAVLVALLIAAAASAALLGGQ